jgi:hypothetical protein
MILSFDVDCGELVSGHHFIARGLGGPYRLPIPDEWDGDSAEYKQMLELADAGGYPGFSLEYELVPGVSAAEAGGNLFRFLVGVSYDADVKLPWAVNDGGAIAPFDGGDATHGSRGDWPLPPDATFLTFTLTAVGPDGFPDYANPAGNLVVDLARGNAAWHPAGAIT